MSSNTLLYPNVTTIPVQRPAPGGAGESRVKGQDGEFGRVLDQELNPASQPKALPELNQIRAPLRFSAHAAQRLKERNISFDQDMMTKIRNAVDKAESKGLSDTLVLTKNAALIINTENRTVITAMDTKSMEGNIFTNIDGAVII